MRWLLLAALLVAEPRAVHAGSSCGGGGSSSGGSSSGGSSSGGSSSGGSSSSDGGASEGSTGGCIDDTDVHGFRHCTKFGAWGKTMRIPRLFIEAGAMTRSFPSALGGTSGSITHGAESFSYRVVMPGNAATSDVALTSQLRIGFGIGGGLYSGIELEAGGLVAPAAASTEMTGTGTFGSPNVDQQAGILLGVTGIGGYRAAGRRGSLGIEGAGGLRSVHYRFASSYHACETETTIAVTRAVVEARARAEVWLSPWLTAGVTLGANVLDKNDWMAGLYVGAHSRAFAGSR